MKHLIRYRHYIQLYVTNLPLRTCSELIGIQRSYFFGTSKVQLYLSSSLIIGKKLIHVHEQLYRSEPVLYSSLYILHRYDWEPAGHICTHGYLITLFWGTRQVHSYLNINHTIVYPFSSGPFHCYSRVRTLNTIQMCIYKGV